MGRVLGHEQLGYRDGRAGDVDPVRIEDLPGGAVRVVVTYPPAAQDRARARWLWVSAVAAASVAVAWRMGFRSSTAWWVVPMTVAQLSLTFAVVTFILWWRTGWVYAFEAGGREFVVETRGRLFSKRRACARERVSDVRVFRDGQGQAKAMEIKSSDASIGGPWLAGLGTQDIDVATAAIREALGMAAVP